MSAYCYKVIVRGKVFGEATTLAEAEAAAKKHGGKVLQEMGKTSNPRASKLTPFAQAWFALMRTKPEGSYKIPLGDLREMQASYEDGDIDDRALWLMVPQPTVRAMLLPHQPPADLRRTGNPHEDEYIPVQQALSPFATAWFALMKSKGGREAAQARSLLPLYRDGTVNDRSLFLTTSGADLAKLPAPAAAMARPLAGRASNPPLEHSNAAILLDTVKPGKPQVIHGVKVSRVGSGYSIDRVVLSRELAIKRLEQGGKTANPKAERAAKVQTYGPKAGAVEPVLPPSTNANFFAFASAVAKATKSKMVRSPTFFVYVPDFGAFHDSAMMGKKTNDGQTLWVLEAWLEPTGNARAPFVFSIAVLARDSRSLKEDPNNGVQIYAVSGNLTERTFSPALVAKIASHVEKWAANTDHPTPLGADGFPVSPAYRESNPKAKKPAGPVVYI